MAAAMASTAQVDQGGPEKARPTADISAAPQGATAFREMATKYCVGCHNTRNPLPAGMPLALDTANFEDPGADAARWERVVKKLGVGAMPPQGSPTPGAAELTRFRAALITSLDAAAARKNNPGQYVKLADTVQGFKEILDGKHDSKPESAFYLKGGIDMVKEAK